MAAHESPRTTKVYDRTGDAIRLDEVERITIRMHASNYALPTLLRENVADGCRGGMLGTECIRPNCEGTVKEQSYQGKELEILGGSFGRIQGAAQAGFQNGDLAGYIIADGVHDNGWRDFSSSSD
jgi:hypothetical protein